jgi:hypothetical protein
MTGRRGKLKATNRGYVVKLQAEAGNVDSVPTSYTTRLFGSRAMQPQYTPDLLIEDLSPYIDADGDCWEWTGSINLKGYGSLSVKVGDKWIKRPAHRLVWIALCGPMPEGLQLDHLCRLRRCVNPDHLEPVTLRVNVLRGIGLTAQNALKTHCKRGHCDWRHNSAGWRDCHPCHLERSRKSKARQRASIRNGG